MNSPRRRRILGAIALAAGTFWLVTPRPIEAGAFIFAGEINGVDLVAHPSGYTGVGGPVTVGVCIDPSSANASAMEISVRNVVDTFNQLEPVTGNVIEDSPELAPGESDFESTVLHEVGHCIGLAHPNAAGESGLSGADREYTRATDGVVDDEEFDTPDFDLGAGGDGVPGSSDDARGDDVNLHWFRISNNNPFTLAATVDSTTYARDTSSLPGGHTFAANGDRTVASGLGFADTEVVMQQGTESQEVQRELAHDDVATLLYARAGLDSLAGTADDYTVTLTYEGLTTDCEIVLDFDDSETFFAKCSTGGSFLTADDAVITSAAVFFSTAPTWFFNDTLTVESIFADGFESGDTSAWD